MHVPSACEGLLITLIQMWWWLSVWMHGFGHAVRLVWMVSGAHELLAHALLMVFVVRFWFGWFQERMSCWLMRS